MELNDDKQCSNLKSKNYKNRSLACLAANYLSKHESFLQTLSEIEILPTLSSILECNNSSQSLIHVTESQDDLKYEAINNTSLDCFNEYFQKNSVKNESLSNSSIFNYSKQASDAVLSNVRIKSKPSLFYKCISARSTISKEKKMKLKNVRQELLMSIKWYM